MSGLMVELLSSQFVCHSMRHVADGDMLVHRFIVFLLVIEYIRAELIEGSKN